MLQLDDRVRTGGQLLLQVLIPENGVCPVRPPPHLTLSSLFCSSSCCPILAASSRSRSRSERRAASPFGSTTGRSVIHRRVTLSGRTRCRRGGGVQVLVGCRANEDKYLPEGVRTNTLGYSGGCREGETSWH